MQTSFCAQVLTPLSWPDLLWVAALPGMSEELLFRGALIPALFPDWCGAPVWMRSLRGMLGM